MDPSFLPLCEYIALVAENLTAIQKRCALRGYVPTMRDVMVGDVQTLKDSILYKHRHDIHDRGLWRKGACKGYAGESVGGLCEDIP